ncbi:metallophosphoesterase [Vagococcus vulneris]|uniref:Phosphoesterase n=1 Tax=Vagococcus vulneris TaxID=1977869 RepID=A0A430A0Z0_9ENTE|nr:metallophosphoesterase [Vagococcus vulneris]RSU00071.1 YfcE family phosphodiesterase [Vagococcus vulneris]
MKILAVSDNHGDRDVLVDILAHWQNKVDGFFHCGDSELEASDSLWRDYVVVKGNCDYDPKYRKTQTVDLDGVRIFMTHGHLYGVNTGMMALSYAAQEEHADIVLYGHTHKLAAELADDMVFVNPGSISQPRGRYSHLKTYAIIEDEADKKKVSFYNRQHELIPELQVKL